MLAAWESKNKYNAGDTSEGFRWKWQFIDKYLSRVGPPRKSTRILNQVNVK